MEMLLLSEPEFARRSGFEYGNGEDLASLIPIAARAGASHFRMGTFSFQRDLKNSPSSATSLPLFLRPMCPVTAD
jgi:hypothetical protein